MRILIVGYNTPDALECYCAGPLQRMGHVVRFHDVYHHIFRRAKFLYTPVLNKLEYAIRTAPFRRRLLRVASEWQPDLVFVFKGAELRPADLHRLSALPNHPPLVNWNPDNPFDYTTFNTNPHLIASIPLYNVYFIWGREIIAPLRLAGAQRVEYLPFGYSPDRHRHMPLTGAERQSLSSQICFVGGYTPERARLLEALADFEVRIWGPNWRRFLKGSPLHGCLVGDWVYGQEMSKVFLAAEIVLNFIRPQNDQAHNMRTFEAPAAGAFMLATRTREQLVWLPEGIGAAYFSDVDEMRSKAEYYLSHPEERTRIAAEGHRLITSGGHTYADRMRQLMNVVKGL